MPGVDTTAPPHLQCPSAPPPPTSKHIRILSTPQSPLWHGPQTHTTRRQGGVLVPPRHSHLPYSQWTCPGSGDNDNDAIILCAGRGSWNVRSTVEIDGGDMETPPQSAM